MDPTQIREAAKLALDVHQKWRKQAEDDFRMYNGDQWDRLEKKALQDANRPCLTINELKPAVDMAVGWAIQNQYGLKALPKEVGDEGDAKMFTYLLRDVLTNSRSSWIFSRCDTDTYICGRSYKMVNISYDEDAYGRVGIKYVPPLGVLYDPMSIEPDLSDAQYVIRFDTMDMKHMVHVFGERAKECEGIAKDDRIIPEMIYKDLTELQRHKHFMVIEAWWKDYEDKWYTVNPQTGMRYLMENEDEAKRVQQQALMDGFQLGVYEASTPQVKMRTICHSVELASGDTPFAEQDYPIVPQFASIAANEHMGLVTQGKDAQREYNKRRSVQLQIALSTGVRGWKYREGTIKNKQLWLDYGTTPAVLLPYDKMTPPGEEPKEIQPVMAAQEQILAAQMAREDMKSTTGISADLLGTGGDPKTSGRAIFLRQQQGMMGQAHLHQGRKQCLLQLGRLIIRTMQKHYPEGKVFKIMGEDGRYQEMRFNRDPSIGLYDIEVAEAPEGATQRLLNASYFEDFMESMGKFANTPFALPLIMIFLKLSDMPHKDEIQAMLMQAQQGVPGTPPPGQSTGATASPGVTG